MAITQFLKTGGIAALAAAIAVTSVTSGAMAQAGPGFRGAREAAQQQQRQQSAQPQQRSEGRSWGGQSAPRAQQSVQQAPVARQDRGQRNWQGRGDNGRAGDRQGSWQGRGDGQRDRQQAQRVERNGSGAGFRGAVEARNAQSWQGRDRDRDRWNNNNDNNRRWSNNGRWDNDNRRWGNDSRRWSNDWRRDRRYDWQGYRNSNRNVYRLGRYYAPYQNYYYRPLSSGFYLDTLFFGSRYWINDPWQYRLPPAYGPYRWVRYYDDVLLVDTYTGEVVDVIRDFFW